jgi:hypothetical protein
MSVTTEATWHDVYAGAAARLAAAAPTARPALTGTSACVDAIFHVDAARMAQLTIAARAVENSVDDAQGHQVLSHVLERVFAGRGGELLHRWPAGPAWFIRLLGEPDRYQLGGTGPQASWALAVLGAPSVLALADRSAPQLAVLDPRTGLCSDGRVIPAGTVTPTGEPLKLLHCILEFTAGTPFGDSIVPRSTRLILRFGDEPIERDEQFAATTPGLTGPRAGLLSGLNGLADDDLDSVAWLTRLGRAWADAGLQMIHHELAEFPTVARLRDALDTGVASSVGLSLSELYALAGRPGDPRLLARDAAERCGARRLIVHADQWAMAVHRDDPAHQSEVLVAGSLLAAARAVKGRPSVDLALPVEASYADDLPVGGPLGGGWSATTVPSPYLRYPTATIGLGDTFVAGMLLAESLP